MSLVISKDTPDDTEVLLQKAMKCFEAGQETEVERLCKEALNINPELAKAENMLGAVAHMRGNMDLAIAHMKRAAEIDPADSNHNFNIALIYLNKGDRANAIKALDVALEHSPTAPQVLQHRLNMAFEDKDFSAAERLLATALTRFPDQPQMLNLLITTLDIQEKYAQAVPHYRRLLAVSEPTGKQQAGFARALYETGEFKEAALYYEQAVKNGAANASLYYYLGVTCDFLGRHDDAAKYLHEALKADPFHKAAEGAQTLLKLKASNLRDGIDKYSIRQAYGSGHERLFSFPQWNGQSLEGKKLLLWAEQGMGDIVMFSGFLPYLVERGASITLMVYPGLIELFARSFPACRVLPLTMDLDPELAAEGFDFHVPMGHLLTLLKDYHPRLKSGYLIPDAEKVADFKSRHNALGVGKTIGISWFTEMQPSAIVRNIPLPLWKPIFSVGNCQFVSLQYGDALRDIASCASETGIIIHDDGVDNVQDKDTFAAQIASLDGVISVQNTTVHMAGALGVPTVLMLSACADFRWGLKRDDNDWYSSVTLMRQAEFGDWSDVLSRTAGWLKTL